MIDPRHGRRVPSGARFARTLSRVFRATWERIEPLILAGYSPGVADLRGIIERLAAPALGVELVSGYVRTMRGAERGGVSTRRVFRNRGYGGGGGVAVKALRFDPEGFEPATAPTLSPPRVPVPPGVVGIAEVPPSPRLLIDWNLFRPEVRVEAERLALRLAGTIAEDTRRMIRDGISEGLQQGEALPTIAKRIRGEAFSARRAATIAQTESSRAMHAGQGVAASELGVTKWKLLASSDACDICLSIEQKGYVDIGSPLYVWPTGNPAYRVVYHAPVHPHCNCTMEEEMPE